MANNIVIAIIGSQGLWAILLFLLNRYFAKEDKKQDKNSAMSKGVLALLHNKLYDLADTIIEQGYITPEQVENLQYFKEPYFALGGDGTLEQMLKIIDGFEIKRG